MGRTGLAPAPHSPRPASMWGSEGRPPPAQLHPAAPGPPGSRVRRDSRPSAAPAGPSSWCPGARRQVSASQVSGRKWRPGPARTEEQAEAGGGRGREGASEATGGSAAPPSPAQPAPRTPNPAPGPAPARSADPPGGPAPYLGRAPRSSLKGQCPAAARPPSTPLTPPPVAPGPSMEQQWEIPPRVGLSDLNSSLSIQQPFTTCAGLCARIQPSTD